MLRRGKTGMVIPAFTDIRPVAGPPQGQWTYADWERLPDDEYIYEIIDGVLYMSTSPTNFHQWLVYRMVKLVGVPAEDQKLAYPAFAPTGVLMPGCQPVQPDFVLVKMEHSDIMAGDRIEGVPDLIAEVFSPGNRPHDEATKLAAYARAGVPEYVIVDGFKRQVRLHSQPINEEYRSIQIFGMGDTVRFACVPPISFLVSELFGGSPSKIP